MMKENRVVSYIPLSFDVPCSIFDILLLNLRFHATLVFMRLVFVCTGNTCRSPLAVAAWRSFGAPLLREKGIECHAESAGLAAAPGAPAAPHSVTTAREWGVDLSAHRARRLTSTIAGDADFLVALTAQHAEALRTRFDITKVLQLGSFDNHPDTNDLSDSDDLSALQKLLGGDAEDILDPFGGSLEAYQACGAHIRRAVEGLALALRDGKISEVSS